MTGYVANTDRGWFDFLRSLPPQEEVNFWNPSARNIYRGKMGAPLFFRPHVVTADLIAYRKASSDLF